MGSQSINDLSIRKEDTNEIKKVVDNEIKKFFKPEFLNRLDEIVIFNNLELNDIKEIAKIQLQNLEKRLNKKNLKFNIRMRQLANWSKIVSIMPLVQDL